MGLQAQEKGKTNWRLQATKNEGLPSQQREMWQENQNFLQRNGLVQQKRK